MRQIGNILKLPATFFYVMGNLRKQKKFLANEIRPLLKKYEDNGDSTLTNKDFSKIYRYYGLAVPAILGEAFCVLRGTPMTKNERWVLSCQGIVTGLFDDLFDDGQLSYSYIEDLVVNPQNAEASKANIKLFLEYYLKSLNITANSSENKKQAILVMHDQIDSIEQENPDIPYDRLLEITNNKGGNSVLYYRYGMDSLPDQHEIDALFKLGSLMQLENDIFDVHKDIQTGIVTIPNNTTDIADLKSLYLSLLNAFIELSYRMKYPVRNITRFLDIIMPIVNRGFVCIDQYHAVAKKNNGLFEPKQNSRKELICDMETIKNFLRTVQYCYRNKY